MVRGRRDRRPWSAGQRDPRPMAADSAIHVSWSAGPRRPFRAEDPCGRRATDRRPMWSGIRSVRRRDTAPVTMPAPAPIATSTASRDSHAGRRHDRGAEHPGVDQPGEHHQQRSGQRDKERAVRQQPRPPRRPARPRSAPGTTACRPGRAAPRTRADRAGDQRDRADGPARPHRRRGNRHRQQRRADPPPPVAGGGT